MTSRLWITVALVLLVHLAVRLAARPPETVRIEMPDRPIEALPLELAGWVGEDVDHEMDWFTLADARTGINRRYRHPSGQVVWVLVAAYDYLPDRTISLPHRPELCYSLAGYEIGPGRELQVGSRHEFACVPILLPVEREGGETFVLYWYQLDRDGFSSNEGLRQNIWRLRGSGTWPPLLKILMQSEARDAATAERNMVQLAEPLYEAIHEWKRPTE